MEFNKFVSFYSPYTDIDKMSKEIKGDFNFVPDDKLEVNISDKDLYDLYIWSKKFILDPTSPLTSTIDIEVTEKKNFEGVDLRLLRRNNRFMFEIELDKYLKK